MALDGGLAALVPLLHKRVEDVLLQGGTLVEHVAKCGDELFAGGEQVADLRGFEADGTDKRDPPAFVAGANGVEEGGHVRLEERPHI